MSAVYENYINFVLQQNFEIYPGLTLGCFDILFHLNSIEQEEFSEFSELRKGYYEAIKGDDFEIIKLYLNEVVNFITKFN